MHDHFVTVIPLKNRFFYLVWIKALKTLKKLFLMVINGEGRYKTVKDGAGQCGTVRDGWGGGDGQGRSGTIVSRWWTEYHHGSRCPENGNGTVNQNFYWNNFQTKIGFVIFCMGKNSHPKFLIIYLERWMDIKIKILLQLCIKP